MFAIPLLNFLALLPFAACQLNDPELQIRAIQAHFTQADIVPSLLPSFDPSALLVANFVGKSSRFLCPFPASETALLHRYREHNTREVVDKRT
jgi:hypothetical protein